MEPYCHFQAPGLEATFRVPSFKRPFSVPLGTAALSFKGQRVLLFVIAFYYIENIVYEMRFVKENLSNLLRIIRQKHKKPKSITSESLFTQMRSGYNNTETTDNSAKK